MRSGLIVSSVSFLFVLLFSLVIFNGGSLTGNVVFEPSIANGCSPASLNSVWDSIFVESSAGVTRYNTSFGTGVDCAAYIMFKNDSNNNIYVVLREDTSLEQKTEAYYVHGNETLSNFLNGISDYASGLAFVRNGLFNNPDIVDRDILDVGFAAAEFNSRFSFANPSAFIVSGDGYSFVDTDSGNQPGGVDKGVTGHIVRLETIDYVEFINYTGYYDITFDSDISDYTFAANSSWNDAFDFGSHFDYGADATLGIRSYGTDNVDGEYIDFELDGDDATFRPSNGFVGSRDFIVYVNNSYVDVVSNEFTISIVNQLPEAPNVYSEIGNVFLKPGESSVINLLAHFEDINDDTLSYSYTGGEDLDITISGDSMTIMLGSNFSDVDSIVIIADDGGLDVSSNEIFIFLDTSIGDDTGGDDPLENLSVEFDVSINETDNLDIERDNLKWIIIGATAVLVIIGVGLFVYYFTLGRPKPVENKPELVNSYLSRLKKKGVVTSFSGLATRPVKTVASKLKPFEGKPVKIIAKTVPIKKVVIPKTISPAPKLARTVIKPIIVKPKLLVKDKILSPETNTNNDLPKAFVKPEKSPVKKKN